MDNLGKMDKLLENNLPKLNQEKVEGLKRLTTVNEIEPVIRKLLAHKWSGLDSFTGEFYQIFRIKLTQTLLKLFQKKVQEEGRLPNSFHNTSIILIPKPGKDTT